MGEIISIIVGYLLGSVSFSYIIARKMAGIDIREHGSKNAGATNTLRVLGKGPALLVLLLDALKGSVAILLAMLLTDLPIVFVLTGLAAIAGHNWPLFFGFKGGKGVATSIGVMATLVPFPFLLALFSGLLVLFLFRYVSLASIIGTIVLPICILIFQPTPAYFIMAIIIMLLAIYSHRSNLKRLLRGEEPKLGKKK
jgi:glycerol-3-phosphate acyltransferase PlsY